MALDVPLDDDTLRPDWTGDDALYLDGTNGNARTVLLQRLANPLRPFDATANPYITVDRSSFDVTRFNGVVDDASDPKKGTATVSFESFQRGGSHDFGTGTGWDQEDTLDMNKWPDIERRLWDFTLPRIDDPVAASPDETAVGPHHFPKQLYHTLGFLNSRYGPYFNMPPAANMRYRGAPDTATGGMTGNYKSFPWLNHNNRPFTSPLELLQVPAVNQYDLLGTFSVRNVAAMPTTLPEHNNTPNNVRGAYNRTLNFFLNPSSPTPTTAEVPNFGRLLDYVQVPSPYAYSDKFYNADHFSSAAGPFTPPDAGLTYRPPHHRRSNFRDPGRININTVFDVRVLQAIFKGHPYFDSSADATTGTNMGTQFANRLLVARQGYGTAAPAADNAYPSIFSAPFRAMDAGDLAPFAALQQTTVNAGLLRQTPAGLPMAGQPLFAFDLMNDPAAAMLPAARRESQNTDRNPYFRYQGYQKIGNLLTTQSNCFAVWITIGYFEVTDYRDPMTNQITFDAAHPDGLQLGAELGEQTGEIVRHRAFFLIDRSIPVGFMPGQLNTDECILLRRFIE